MKTVRLMDQPDSCSLEAKIAIAKMKWIKTSFDEILEELTQQRSKELRMGKGRIATSKVK
jgi:predicted CopG family antitoxin